MHLSTAILLSLLSAASAQTYNSSFTQYGGGDQNNSPNCNTATAACGFYNYPGYNAAVSQNLYGAGPGQGAGPACGTCWLLTPKTEADGTPIVGANSIVVMVNNLCPADVNPEQCGQTDLSGDSTNAEGATVNFDLCIDDGAASQFFGSSPQQLAVGTAMQVSCSDWSGSADITSGSNTATTGPTPTVSAGSSATTLTTVTSSGPATALQTLYGECGTGPTYTGPTACQPTATCSSQNPYYSQCLPTSG